MKSSNKAQREKGVFSELSVPKKLQYIWDYYKLPLFVCGIVLYVIVYALYGHFTHKDAVLYASFVNVAPGETAANELTAGFLDYLGADPAKNELKTTANLYLTADENNPYHEYTYASRMKILASIDAEQMDVVFMNREAFDAFAQKGYLCDLEELFGQEVPYQAQTQEYSMAFDLSQTRIIRQAGFEDTVYLGILKNSPRLETAKEYVRYLFAG